MGRSFEPCINFISNNVNVGNITEYGSDDRTVTKGTNVVENSEFLSFQITDIDNVLFAFQINNGGDYSFYGTNYIPAGWNTWNAWEQLGYCNKS